MSTTPNTPSHEDLSRWKSRREVRLDPPTSRPDQPARIVLTPAAMGQPYQDAAADGGDLRIADADGKTPLPYWIERWNTAGRSTVWVRVLKAGTDRLLVCHGNPAARSRAQGREVFPFFDDFSDGLWTKHPDNPVMTRSEAWEAATICEPCVLHEDGLFKMWYMGTAKSYSGDAAVGYATSRDGITWRKHPNNPILSDPEGAVIRTTVVKHEGTYYLFASDYQWNDAPGVINRWTSDDGLTWRDKVTVLRPTAPWEDHFHNTGVVVDENGTWQMLTTTDNGPMGYAYSDDGVHWTQYEGNPVITGFYGGDPCLKQIGGRYFIWYSHAHHGLRICCSWSDDMIHWTPVYNNPQIGFTQPWERGLGRPDALWATHLTDAELVEHDGRVYMFYQGAQTPFGLAVFEGTFEQLAGRLMTPPLSQWADSPNGSVEGGQLKLSEDETDVKPVVENAAAFSDREGHVFEFRAQCYAGASYQIKPVVRYVDERNFARFWIMDNETTFYQECTEGTFRGAANIGANKVCDRDWHAWRIVVRGATTALTIDGRFIGQWDSRPALTDRDDLTVGFSVFDAYAAFADIRVRRYDEREPAAVLSSPPGSPE